jgi:signal transduction histidine kinase
MDAAEDGNESIRRGIRCATTRLRRRMLATIVGVMSGPLLSFAEFLGNRQGEILADWQSAARPNDPDVPANDTARTGLVTGWLQEVTALAEGREATLGALLRNSHGDNPTALTIVSDLSVLHRVITRRAHVEQASCGLQELELLWQAFEDGLADLIGHDNAAQRRPETSHIGEVPRMPTELRERFLGEASRVLAESLDYERTLRTVARLAVPEIADWCIIDLLRDDGTLVRVATEHRDPNREGLAAALHHNPPRNDAVSGAPNVVRTGVTEHVVRMSESVLRQRERDQERLSILTSLGLNSTICTPLVARERVLGAITLSTAVGRDLTLDDVRMTEDLARRAAVAIDNARLHDDAQRALRAREEILAIVTHDLRTPLSAVVAAASLLTSMDSVDPNGDRIRQRGETIQRAAQHMSRLVQDLTDLAQIDSGRLAIEGIVENPADIVREAVEALEPVVMRRGGTLHAQTSSNLPRVSLDRDRVRQVLANLVGNASKVGASKITIGADVHGADLVFWVADDGPGIPPEDLPRMFDRFWRGRGTQYKGSGLGLPISNGIVKAHGGRMWIESTVGAGSTFFFSLPR